MAANPTFSRPHADEHAVFCGNLSFETRWQTLKDHFRQVGTPTNAKVITDREGRSRGYGIVSFATKAEADEAVRVLHNSVLDGRSILVRPDRPPGQRD